MSDKNIPHKLTDLRIEPDDAAAVLDFWHHFELDVPTYLTEAIELFRQDPNLDTQDKFRSALCKAISEGREDIFEDEIFIEIKKNTDKIYFNDQFYSQLKETLSE